MVGIDDGNEDLILMRCVTAVIAVSFVLTSNCCLEKEKKKEEK